MSASAIAPDPAKDGIHSSSEATKEGEAKLNAACHLSDAELFSRIRITEVGEFTDGGQSFSQPHTIDRASLSAGQFGAIRLVYESHYASRVPGESGYPAGGRRWTGTTITIDDVVVANLRHETPLAVLGGHNSVRADLLSAKINYGGVIAALRTTPDEVQKRVTGWLGFSDGMAYESPTVVSFADPVLLLTSSGWGTLAAQLEVPHVAERSICYGSELVAAGLRFDRADVVSYPLQRSVCHMPVGGRLSLRVRT
jgi:hypothetical protein